MHSRALLLWCVLFQSLSFFINDSLMHFFFVSKYFGSTVRSSLVALLFTYRRLTRFYTPLTRFYSPIISSIWNEFAIREKYVVFWYTNLQLTAERSHYLMWLKSLCSWEKARQRWVKARQATISATIWAAHEKKSSFPGWQSPIICQIPIDQPLSLSNLPGPQWNRFKFRALRVSCCC